MKPRVLVVDDESQIVNIIQFTLEHNDFEVLVALDGQEGLQIAREEKPDLIILDLMLPKIDGYKVCRLLKFDKKYRHIPIILLSARSESEDRALGRQVGADDFLGKPFEGEELVAKINELLDTRVEN